MKKYTIIIGLYTISIFHQLVPTTGSICSNLIAGNQIVGKQKMNCKGTGTGTLNAVGDQVFFTNLPRATDEGIITADTPIFTTLPANNSIMVYEFTPTQGNFANKPMQILLASYSLEEQIPAGTPTPIKQGLSRLASTPNTEGFKSHLKVFRRPKPVEGKPGTMYRTREPLWTEGSAVTFTEEDPSMIGSQKFVIHSNGDITLPDRGVTFAFSSPM